jgi:peroxiredoxin
MLGPSGRGVGVGIQSIDPLPVGALVPAVGLRAIDGKAVELSALLKGRPTVLIFYRGGWCPYCNLQMEQLMGIEPELLRLGYQILAISPDKPAKLLESLDKHHLNYALYSDHGYAAAQAFGLAYQPDPATVEGMKKHGVDLQAASGDARGWLPAPAAYVIDPLGRARFVFTNPDIRVRVGADELLRAARQALPAKEQGERAP